MNHPIPLFPWTDRLILWYQVIIASDFGVLNLDHPEAWRISKDALLCTTEHGLDNAPIAPIYFDDFPNETFMFRSGISIQPCLITGIQRIS